jgi:hypothetical protein
MIALLLIVNLAGLLALMWYTTEITEEQEFQISLLKRRVERLENERARDKRG